MKVLEKGHKFLLATLDGDIRQELQYVKRNFPPEKFPGNFDAYSGTTTQEVLRTVISRAQYVDKQRPHWANTIVINSARHSILALETRAAETHGRVLTLEPGEFERIELLPTCRKCGHIKHEC